LADELDRCGASSAIAPALSHRFLPSESERLDRIEAGMRQARVATLIPNDVLYHDASRRMLQDVVTSTGGGSGPDSREPKPPIMHPPRHA
jgi:hypothetical protein